MMNETLTDLVPLSVVTDQHESIAETFVRKVQEILEDPFVIASYSVRNNSYSDCEQIELQVNSKTLLSIRIDRNK